MKSILATGVLAAVILSGTAFVPAGQSADTQAPTPEPGFTALFNGRDLSDWKLVNPESFRIEDGAIVTTGGPGHAFYDGPVGNHAFTDFEFRADVMTRAGANGGIYVMTAYDESRFPPQGFEVQVNNSYERDPIRTGSLYHVVDITTAPARDDEWFTMAVVARGRTITVTVNGTQATTWTQPDDWQGTFRRNGRPEFPERRIQPGTIALQAHDPNSTVHYRNLRLRVLDSPRSPARTHRF